MCSVINGLGEGLRFCAWYKTINQKHDSIKSVGLLLEMYK